MDELKPHIVTKFQSGSEMAFAKIFRLLNRHFFHQAYAMVGTKRDAEELVSDAFFKLWLSREGLTESGPIFTFLERTVHYGCLQVLQRRHLEQSRLSELENTQTIESIRIDLETSAIRAELMADVMAEIEKLSDRRKSIMKLAVVEQLTDEEIAQTLGLTKRTVYNTKFSAMERLRDALGKDAGSIALLIYIMSKSNNIN